MKLSALLVPTVALTFVSCASMDPEYAEYKRQKEAEQAAMGNAADPYGTGGANPYGVPGGSDVGTYTPQGGDPYAANAPGGNPPSLPAADPYSPNPRSGFPTIPGPPPGGTVATHVVAKGDSLWALSRKYNTSVDSIRQANGLSGDRIVIGTTLQIPQN